jgi:hypothetical protein
MNDPRVSSESWKCRVVHFVTSELVRVASAAAFVRTPLTLVQVRSSVPDGRIEESDIRRMVGYGPFVPMTFPAVVDLAGELRLS